MNDQDMAIFEVECPFAQYPIPAAGTGVTQSETGIGIMGAGTLPIDLGSIIYHPSTAITPSNTNYSTMSVYKRTGTGGAVLLGSITNSVSIAPYFSGTWTAFLQVPLVLVAGAFVSPGDSITFAVATTGGTGLAFPTGIVGIFAKGR